MIREIILSRERNSEYITNFSIAWKYTPGVAYSHLYVYFYALKGEEMRRKTHILSAAIINVLGGFNQWNYNTLTSLILLALSYSKLFFWSERAFSWISMTSCLKYQLLYKLCLLFFLILSLLLLSWNSNVVYILSWVSKVTEYGS